MKSSSTLFQTLTTWTDASTPSPQLLPTERLLKIADLKGCIKHLQDTLAIELEELEKQISLGLLDDYSEEDSFVYEGIKCTPVVTRRWEYDKGTKKAIKQLQEVAQYQGDAVQKTTTSYRFTF